MPGLQHHFVDGIRRKLFCQLCRLPMRDPVHISTCGHRYCDSCLQDYLSQGVFVCPEDSKPLDYAKIFPDPDTQLEIMSSAVRCIHHKDGCRWVDKLHNMQAHLEVCRYDSVPCPNECAAMLSRMCLQDHLEYTCSKRKVICDSCGKEYTGEEMETHQGNCPQEIVWCENKCGARLQQRYLNNHMKNECHKRTLACPYCNKDFVFETLQNHYYTCPRFPVSCSNRCDMGKVPREELDKHLTETCPCVTVACSFKEAGCKYLAPRVSMEKHLDDSLRSHLSLMCNLVVQQEKDIIDLSHRLSQATRITDGTLIWKVPNFKQQLADCKLKGNYEMKSDPFYTSRYGYKLGASVFLDGNGSGEGTHLSLYIKVLHGEYDNILEWPFRMPITFRLLDQCSDPEKQQNIVESFVPNPSWKHFQKPVKDADPMGFGYPKFVAHDVLKHATYVRDDAIFIKITVDSPTYIIPSPSNSL